MKTIDTKKFDQMFFEDLDKKISALKAKKEKLEAEFEDLNQKHDTAKAKLAELKDDITAYKKQFHIISSIKTDISAIQSLISVTDEEIRDLERTAPKYWKEGIEKYKKIINPYVEQYAEKKAELFEIFIQMIRAQHAINQIGSHVISRYHLNDADIKENGFSRGINAPNIEPMNPTDAQYFRNNFLKMAKGDESKVFQLMNSGELDK